MKKIKIFYTDMWSDFKLQSKNNYFTKLLSERYEVEVTNDNPDILLYSVFGEYHKKYNIEKKIFFTGENKEPYGDYNLAFSFNYEEDDRHLRLPLYSYFCYEENSIGRVISKTKSQGLNFCSFMVGNLNHGVGSKLRVNFFNTLSEYKKVLSSGRSLRNVDYNLDDQNGVNDWRIIKDKILQIEQPKFMITFENQSNLGYTTEKLYDALINGIVPIYWGNPEVHRDFNINSFINISDFKNTNEAIEYIIELDKNDLKYNEILNSNIIETSEHQKYFDNNRILDSISNLIEHKKTFNINYENLKHPNEVFDCIYCLNLNKRQDRWKNVNKRFIREGLKVKRIEGIDKDVVSVEEFNKILKTNKKTVSNIGSYAILKGFRKILNDFKKSNYESILIFEDDVTFHKDFIYLFNLHYNSLPKNWSIWYLGGTQHSILKSKKINYINDYLYNPINMDGNFAIAINRNILNELLILINNNEYPLDSLIKEQLQPTNKNIYTSYPLICGHSMDDYSDNWGRDFTKEYIKNNWKNRYYDEKTYY